MKSTFRTPRLGRLLLVLGMLAASSLVVTATAPAATVSQTTTMTYTGMNTCAGEMFSGTGTARFDLSESVATDGSIHHHLATRIDGLKAVAMISGKKYVVQETYFDEFNFVGASEETFSIRAHYIRVGEDGSFILGDDFYEYIHTHITANDQGMVTSFSVDTSDDPCR